MMLTSFYLPKLLQLQLAERMLQRPRSGGCGGFDRGCDNVSDENLMVVLAAHASNAPPTILMQRRWRRGCGNVGGDEATSALARSYCNVGGVVAAAALTARLRQRQRRVLDGRLGPRDYAPSKILMQRRWRRGCGDVGSKEEATTALAHFC